MSILASQTIGFIGAGNMAEALIRGLVRGGHVAANRVRASAPRRERLDELAAAYGIEVTSDNREVARGAGIVVLSVKPQIMDKVLREKAGERPEISPDSVEIDPRRRAADHSPGARGMNLVCPARNAVFTVPVGPLRCFEMMSSAMPSVSAGIERSTLYISSR